MPHRVLIAPLPWGLGHASRCIPIVRAELAKGSEVIIAANGPQKALLQLYFPGQPYIDLPFMNITYPADGNMVRHFTLNGPKLLYSIWREHLELQRVVIDQGIDLVISDARFGLWTRHCRCVLIHHQLAIRSPRFQDLIDRLNRWVMKRYDEVWVPDFEAVPGLAGDLSHPGKPMKNDRYIGPLSRFEAPPPHPAKHSWDCVAIVSGPEPQRSIFEADLVRQFIEDKSHALLLRGKPHEPGETSIGNLRIVHHLEDGALAEALAGAEKIIARSGYSTIMDLHALGQLHKAVFVPTPGQTEQEYLARLHNPSEPETLEM